jgi:hypothetical protein
MERRGALTTKNSGVPKVLKGIGKGVGKIFNKKKRADKNKINNDVFQIHHQNSSPLEIVS